MKMFNFIGKIDFLSPPITLFHLEKRTHTSKLSGLFVLSMIVISSSYICILLYDLIEHKKLTSIFHKKFEYEAGYYSFNSSSIFHFIQIFSPEDGGYFDKYDTKYIRAYTTYVHSNFTYANLHLYDHWVFDTCRENIDNKNVEPYLFDNVENFTNGVCIRHYYNSTEKKYYSLEDEGFEWPHLEHGIAQRSNIYLTTFVQKCSNDSVINKLFGPCPSQIEIDNYLSKYFGVYLYFTDTQVDPTNYTKPIQKYLQVVSTGIGTSQTFVESYIHFSPLKVRTKIGSLFETVYDIDSFYFDFNRKGSANNNEKYFTITKYYHLMQNNIQIYERKYNNIFDVFSEIGGVIQFIFYFFYWINYLYNKYVIAYDTNSIFFTIRDKHPYNRDNKNSQTNLNKNDIRLFNLRSNIDRNMEKSNNFLSSHNLHFDKLKERGRLSKIKDQIIIGNKNQKEGKDNKIVGELLNKEDNNDNIQLCKIHTPNKSKSKFYVNQNTSSLFLKDNNDINTNQNKLKNINLHNNSNSNINNKNEQNLNTNEAFGGIYENLKINLGKNNNNNIYYLNVIDLYNRNMSIKDDKNKAKTISDISDTKLKSIKAFTFFDYLQSMIFKRRKGNLYFISIFRKHLLSEEHLLKSHIKMVFMEKQHDFHGEENTNILECFNEL